MNLLNIFEDRISGIFGASKAPFSFKKLAKQAAHEMEDQTLVINGVNTAPALYTVLIANDDDPIISPYYPQLAREVAEFVKAQAQKKRYDFVGDPLVRFMIDPSLKAGKFSVFAENVDRPTLARLFEEERAYLKGPQAQPVYANRAAAGARSQQPVPAAGTNNAAGVNNPVANANPAALNSLDARVPHAVAPAASDPFAPAPADPFAPSPANAPIPVPKTMTREQLAGLGGAAAAASAGSIAGVAANAAAVEGAAHLAPRAQMPMPPLAHLVDVVTGDTYDITSHRSVIGRERAAADVVLRDPNVSRKHAELTFTGSDWSIEDLNSTNGTLVNNRRISRCPLRNGDVLTFGLSTFEFRG